MKKFSDYIYYMMHDDNNDEPYLFYIKGTKFSLQIDAGNSPKSYKQFEELLEEEGLKKPDLLVLTHWHWDHTFGLISAKCPVIASNKNGKSTEDVQKAIHALQKLASNEQEVITKITSEYMTVVKFSLAQARKVWTAAAAWSSGVHKESVEYCQAVGDVSAEQFYSIMEAVH